MYFTFAGLASLLTGLFKHYYVSPLPPLLFWINVLCLPLYANNLLAFYKKGLYHDCLIHCIKYSIQTFKMYRNGEKMMKVQYKQKVYDDKILATIEKKVFHD